MARGAQQTGTRQPDRHPSDSHTDSFRQSLSGMRERRERMAAITNQPEQQGVWARLGFTWEGVAEHRPVSGLTVWLLKLAAISSALVLFFAAVIIGISVTDPAAIAPQGGLMHFANMAMSFGVDGALPGIFFTAVESWQQDGTVAVRGCFPW